MGAWYVGSLVTCALRAEHEVAWQMPLKSPRGWAEPLKQTRRMMYAVPAGRGAGSYATAAFAAREPSIGICSGLDI